MLNANPNVNSGELTFPKPPTTAQLLLEFPKASLELMQLRNKKWKSVLQQAHPGDGHAVMTVPGFGGGDGSMLFLRRYLSKLGYRAEPWGLGTNLPKGRVTDMDQIMDYCRDIESSIANNCERIVQETGEKVSLVGWSLGGVFSNTLAQTRPDLIRQVITLGSPLGDPRGTSTWELLKKINRSDVPEEVQDVTEWLQRKDQLAEREVRTSILYSLTDGAVSKGSAVIEGHHLIENIQVKSSHVGFAHNPLVYWVIADRLAQHPVAWESFDIKKQPLFIQKKMA